MTGAGRGLRHALRTTAGGGVCNLHARRRGGAAKCRNGQGFLKLARAMLRDIGMDIVDVQFPLARMPPGLRLTAQRLLGRGLGLLRPRRLGQLERGEVGAALSRGDRWLLAALVARHERAGTLGQLGALHDWLWSSTQALRFHEQAQARFDSWWRARHSAILEPLQQALQAQPGRYDTLCEIGCGSGLVLQDLADRLPQLRQLIGLDLNATQIARNRVHYAGEPRLRFDSGDAAAWLRRHAEPGWILFSNAGVLEYFAPDKLAALLAELAATRRPLAIASVEPLADDYDLQHETASRIYGPERSWSHPYPRLYREAGLEILWQREQRVGGLRWLLLFAGTP